MGAMSRWILLFLAGKLAACSTDSDPARSTDGGGAPRGHDGGASPGARGSDGASPELEADAAAGEGGFEGVRGTRIFEIRKPVTGDGAPIASDNYFCSSCIVDEAARAAFEDATYPDGFMLAPRRTLVAARGSLLAPVNSRGAAETLDLIEAIEGEEFRLGAQPLFGEFLDGMAVLVTMESSRRLAWDAGDTVHELSDGADTYVLFAQVREPGVATPEAMALPAGFSHATRVLDQPFVLEAVPRVVVFMQLTDQHLWQRIRPPE